MKECSLGGISAAGSQAQVSGLPLAPCVVSGRLWRGMWLPLLGTLPRPRKETLLSYVALSRADHNVGTQVPHSG